MVIMPKLKNKRHEAFCLEYRRNGFNGLQAYKTVYKCSDTVAHKSASRLLAKVGIKDRLDELGKKDTLRYGIDMEELVNDLKNIKDHGLERIPIIGGKEGEIFGYKRAELSSSIKAIDTLIKIAGEYAPTKTDNKNINYDGGDAKTLIEDLENQKNKLKK